MRKELGRVRAELRTGTASEREKAIQDLHRLVNAAAENAGSADMTLRERMDAWWLARHEVVTLPEIAEALIEAMEDSSVRVRGTTTLMLSDVRTEDADAALIHHLLTDPVAHVRVICCGTLRRSSEPHIVEAYIAALGDSEARVVFSACAALGLSGDIRSVEPLRKVLNHPHWNVRYYAAEALVELGSVDESLVALLEELVTQPEADKHDEIITSANEINNEGGSSRRSLTTREVSQKARQRLG